MTIIFYEIIFVKWFLRMSGLVLWCVERLPHGNAFGPFNPVYTEHIYTLRWYYKTLTINCQRNIIAKGQQLRAHRRSEPTSSVKTGIFSSDEPLRLHVGQGFLPPMRVISFGHWRLRSNFNNWHSLQRIKSINDSWTFGQPKCTFAFLIFSTFYRKMGQRWLATRKSLVIIVFHLERGIPFVELIMAHISRWLHGGRYRMFVFSVIILS